MRIPVVSTPEGEAIYVGSLSACPTTRLPRDADEKFIGTLPEQVVLIDHIGNCFKFLSLDKVSDLFVGARVTWTSVSTLTVGTAGKKTTVAGSAAEYLINFVGTIAVDITVSGAGGLDTGVEAADTWYAVLVIADSSGTNPPSAILTTTPAAPTLPVGYDVYRRVGWVRNNSGSNFLKFYQFGSGRDRWYVYDEERTNVQPLSGGNATAFTTVSAAAFIPPGVQDCRFLLAFDSGNPSSIAKVRRADSAVANPVSYMVVGVAAPTAITGELLSMVDANRDFQYAVTVPTDQLDVYVAAFKDEI